MTFDDRKLLFTMRYPIWQKRRKLQVFFVKFKTKATEAGKNGVEL